MNLTQIVDGWWEIVLVFLTCIAWGGGLTLLYFC